MFDIEDFSLEQLKKECEVCVNNQRCKARVALPDMPIQRQEINWERTVIK